MKLKLTLPAAGSHKGQNGKLLIIGGSHLFHAASLWSLTVASRIVDLVHYSSVPENNELVKHEFRNGIVTPRSDIDAYIAEDDVILIGPGMTRDEETKQLTDTLLATYPKKQWVIDAGSLQMMDLTKIPKGAILTPHHQEYAHLFGDGDITNMAKKYQCIILLKGEKDVASNGRETRVIEGGNPGMTKGGTGDVLAGLIAALACTNDPFLATIAGSFINKKAGDALYKKVGPYFNATDLANQIPVTMKELLL
jgi:NAD(P)H-hydrate epimerase